MIKRFLRWLKSLLKPKEKLKVREKVILVLKKEVKDAQ